MVARPSIVKLPNAKEKGGLQELTRRTLLAGTPLAALSAGTAKWPQRHPSEDRHPVSIAIESGRSNLQSSMTAYGIARSLTSSSVMRRFLK